MFETWAKHCHKEFLQVDVTITTLFHAISSQKVRTSHTHKHTHTLKQNFASTLNMWKAMPYRSYTINLVSLKANPIHPTQLIKLFDDNFIFYVSILQINKLFGGNVLPILQINKFNLKVMPYTSSK